MTFGLWARRASRLLHPAVILNWKADDRTRTDNLLITNQLLCQLSHIGISGWRRIRTFEGVANRFTVCPLWPLGNPSIFLKQIASTSIYLYHICSENASNFLSFLHPSICMLYLAYLSKIIFQFCKISFFIGTEIRDSFLRACYRGWSGGMANV